MAFQGSETVSSGILMGCHSPIICGAAGFTDTDTRKGFIGGDLKFGPSTIDQRTDEDGVYLGSNEGHVTSHLNGGQNQVITSTTL